MRRWEYRTVWFDAPGITGKRSVRDSALPKDIKLSGDYSIVDYLNKLGEEGWEVIQIHQPSWTQYFLKRPKQ